MHTPRRPLPKLTLLLVLAISNVGALLWAQYLHSHLLHGDAVVTQQLVQSIAHAANADAYFIGRGNVRHAAVLESTFDRIAHLPEVREVKVLTADATTLWSNQVQPEAKRVGPDEKFYRALRGELVVGTTEREHPGTMLGQRIAQYTIPIHGQRLERVVAVVQLDRAQDSLRLTIAKSALAVWIGAGALLHVVLFLPLSFWITLSQAPSTAGAGAYRHGGRRDCHGWTLAVTVATVLSLVVFGRGLLYPGATADSVVRLASFVQLAQSIAAPVVEIAATFRHSAPELPAAADSVNVWSLRGLILVLATFIASLLNASVGVAGPVIFSAMASVLPTPLVVPLHAAVSFFGNLNQWYLLRQFVHVRRFTQLTLGTLIGLVLAWPLVGRVPESALQCLAGTFLLLITWSRLSGPRSHAGAYPYLGGAITSFLSTLVGVTKPFVVGVVAQFFDDHKTVVATANANVTLQQAGKVALFALAGVPFLQYWELLGTLIMAFVVGGWSGKRILRNAPQRLLKLALKAIVTLLAINLLAMGLGVY